MAGGQGDAEIPVMGFRLRGLFTLAKMRSILMD